MIYYKDANIAQSLQHIPTAPMCLLWTQGPVIYLFIYKPFYYMFCYKFERRFISVAELQIKLDPIWSADVRPYFWKLQIFWDKRNSVTIYLLTCRKQFVVIPNDIRVIIGLATSCCLLNTEHEIHVSRFTFFPISICNSNLRICLCFHIYLHYIYRNMYFVSNGLGDLEIKESVNLIFFSYLCW